MRYSVEYNLMFTTRSASPPSGSHEIQAWQSGPLFRAFDGNQRWEWYFSVGFDCDELRAISFFKLTKVMNSGLKVRDLKIKEVS